MNIVLVHPKHGAKVAIHETEMRQDLENGWTPFEDGADRGSEDPEAPPEVPEFLNPVKKRGRRSVT